MEAEFWLQRWREGRIGFHQTRVMPLLQKYWPAVGLPRGSRILVPLAGKSLDMIWLARQGYRILGVELSDIAVGQFFAENGLHPQVHESTLGRHYVAGDVEVICGDVLALDDVTLAGCGGFYDRAALIALPPPMRDRYVARVFARLPDDCRGLLITLEYPPEEMAGPPFSVSNGEVETLYGASWKIAVLEHRDILATEPHFAERGVTRMDTTVYLMGRGV